MGKYLGYSKIQTIEITNKFIINLLNILNFMNLENYTGEEIIKKIRKNCKWFYDTYNQEKSFKYKDKLKKKKIVYKEE